MELQNEILKLMNLSSKFKCDLKRVSESEVAFLDAVANGINVKMKDVSRDLNVTPGAVTQMVDKLITKGLLKRTPDETDRRIIYVSLTEEGVKAHQEFRVCQNRISSKLFNALNDAEKASAGSIFLKINNILSTSVGVHS